MDETSVLVARRAGYRVLTLNRPQRLNAFNEDMHHALAAAIAEAEQDESCRALLLTGTGRAFCTGQDLNDRLAKPGEQIVLGGTLEQHYNPLVRKLRALDAAEDNDLSTQLDLERDLQREAGASPDYQEGLRAFFEKRKPVFTGKR